MVLFRGNVGSLSLQEPSTPPVTAGGDATAKKTSPETNARDARTGPSDQTAADKGGHHRRERLSRETPKLVGGAGPRL